jgi:hypothetical protein
MPDEQCEYKTGFVVWVLTKACCEIELFEYFARAFLLQALE